MDQDLELADAGVVQHEQGRKVGRNKNDGEEQDHQPSKTSIMTQGTMDLDEY